MTFYNDTFKTAGNTPLTGGTPPYISDSGATYSAHQAWVNSAAVEVAAGTRMRGNAAQNNIFNISRAAPGSDHSMTCKVYIASTGNSENTGVICRVTQNAIGYWYSLTIFNGKVRLFKNVANTYLQLGLDVIIAESVGATFNLILTCIGSTITGTVIRDSDGFYLAPSGAWQGTPINVFSFVDTSVPLTNNVGLSIGGAADTDTTGYQMASASGSAASSAPTPLQVLDAKAGFGAQGLVRGSVIDGSISGNSNVLTSATAGFVASDVGKDICVVSGNSMPPGSNTAFTAPPAAPTLCTTSGGTLPQTTYFVVITYVSATGGETIASAEVSLTVPANNLLVVKQPTPSGNGWNVYVSAQLQTPNTPGLTLCCCGGSLPASTTYRYKITAVDIHHPLTGATAETAASGENSMMTGVSNNNQITLSWTAVQRAVAYNIYRTSGGTNTETFLTQVPGNLTSYADTGAVTPGTTGPAAPGSDTGTGMGREILQGPPPGPRFNGDWQEASNGLITGPGALITKILGLNSSSQVTLSYSWPFSANPTGSTVTWGIDDTTPFQATITAARNGPNRAIISIPAGQYMITRKLVIGDPVFGAGAAGLMVRGDGNFGSNFGEDPGYIPVSCKSVIVWGGPANQPMIEVFGSINLAFRDVGLSGPANQSASSSLGAPVAGIQLISITGWNSMQMVIDNVTIELCNIGLLMEYGSIANADITSNFLRIKSCINYGLRDMCTNGLNYWMRSLYVGSDATNNPNFVAAQFDQGGWLYWLGGNLTSVPTVLKVGVNGAGNNAAIFVLDGLRLDSQTNNERCTLVDTSNPGGIQNNVISVNNTQLRAGIGNGNFPLFNLGPNTNVTVRSSWFPGNLGQQLAKMISNVNLTQGDTTLVLEDVSYPDQVPFTAAGGGPPVISADPSSYWRSRNCRTTTGTPRFDESIWRGDGVVTPFRNFLFSRVPPTGVVNGGYFRPGNRQQKYIVNEYPLGQLVSGTCTGVFRNSDPYVSGAPVPVLPAATEDAYPGWFDVNSYITLNQGAFQRLFDTPLPPLPVPPPPPPLPPYGNGVCTLVAWVRIPSSSFNQQRTNPIYSNLNVSIGGMSLVVGTSGGFFNTPIFTVCNGTTTSAISASASLTADAWYLIAAIYDNITVPGVPKIYLYWIGPSGALTQATPTGSVLYAQNNTNPRCIGRDDATTTNAIAFIEVVGLLGTAITQSDVQTLWSIGVSGG